MEKIILTKLVKAFNIGKTIVIKPFFAITQEITDASLHANQMEQCRIAQEMKNALIPL